MNNVITTRRSLVGLYGLLSLRALLSRLMTSMWPVLADDRLYKLCWSSEQRDRQSDIYRYAAADERPTDSAVVVVSERDILQKRSYSYDLSEHSVAINSFVVVSYLLRPY